MEIISELPSILFTISIAVTVFPYGLYARSAHLLHPFRAPRIYVLALLAMFIVTPMIALMCAVAFDALALDVPPIARVARARLGGGDTEAPAPLLGADRSSWKPAKASTATTSSTSRTCACPVDGAYR